MSNVAVTNDGRWVLADQMSEAEWLALKDSYNIGQLIMPCCDSAAILKTCQTGRPFFAHHNGECASAPETQWHREGKALISATVTSFGYECREEVFSGCTARKWKADTYFEVANRRIVVELQRSYQHLNEYLRRQKQYADAGVESYWLICPENSHALFTSLARLRIQQEFQGRLQDGIFPCIPELPVAVLETGDMPIIKFPRMLRSSPAEWLAAVVARRFVWEDGAWLIA